MEGLNKIIAWVMLPISILLILEYLGIWELGTPFDKALVASVAIIIMHGISLAMFISNRGSSGMMDNFINLIFVIPAILYLVSRFLGWTPIQHVPLILGVMLLVESLYRLRN